jgi:hypothetical protein
MPTTTRRIKKKGTSPIIFLMAVCAVGLAWIASRPGHTATDFQKVTGTVGSTTAVTKSGANEFTVRVWLSNQPKVAYILAAKVPGEVLGSVRLVPGSTVEMQALTSEMQTPSTGALHNVDATIEIATLSADGKPLSTWEDYQKHAESQKKGFFGLAIGAAVLALLIWFTRKRNQPEE